MIVVGEVMGVTSFPILTDKARLPIEYIYQYNTGQTVPISPSPVHFTRFPVRAFQFQQIYVMISSEGVSRKSPPTL